MAAKGHIIGQFRRKLKKDTNDMFYFLLPSLVTYDFVLVIAAVVPAIFLMIQAYRSDRLEKESPGLLWGLVKAGIFSSLIALVAERVLGFLLDLTVNRNLSNDLVDKG